jgi:hypothetical protein
MRRFASLFQPWVIGVCLLALCLSPAAGAPPDGGRWGRASSSPEKVLFDSAAVVAPSILPAGDRRPRTPGFDSLVAVLHQAVAVVCTGKPVTFLSHYGCNTTPGADRSATPIRSPPARKA